MKQKDILFLVLSITTISFIWIIFTVIHSAVSSTISNEVTKELTPIEGTFNQKILEKLRTRKNTTPLYTVQNSEPPLSPTISPTTTTSPTPPPDDTITPTPDTTSEEPTPDPCDNGDC